MISTLITFAGESIATGLAMEGLGYAWGKATTPRPAKKTLFKALKTSIFAFFGRLSLFWAKVPLPAKYIIYATIAITIISLLIWVLAPRKKTIISRTRKKK